MKASKNYSRSNVAETAAPPRLSRQRADLERVEAMLIEVINTVHRIRRDIDAEATPAQPEWVNVKTAAHRLGVGESTAWRHAVRYGANWPQPQTRLIDFTRLRQVRPPNTSG